MMLLLFFPYSPVHSLSSLYVGKIKIVFPYCSTFFFKMWASHPSLPYIRAEPMFVLDIISRRNNLLLFLKRLTMRILTVKYRIRQQHTDR